MPDPYRDASCYHCGASAGATAICAGCGRLVCPRCAARRRGCPARGPATRRVGWRARVLDIDESGSVALYADWNRTARLRHLTRHRRVRFPGVNLLLGSRFSPTARMPMMCLLADGSVSSLARLGEDYGEVTNPPTDASRVGEYVGVRHRRPEWLLPRIVELGGGARDVLCQCACFGATASLVVRRSGVDVYDLAAPQFRGIVGAELRGVRCAAASAIDDRLAIGSDDGLALLEFESLTRIGAPLPLDEPPVWLGIAGGRLVRIDSGGELHVHALDGRGDWRESTLLARVDAPGIRGPLDASLSAASPLVALRRGGGDVVVCGGALPAPQALGPAGAAPDVIRFVRDGRLLIATARGRLVTWHERGGRIVAAAT